MAQVIVMPRLGNTVESCIIVAWKVREGDVVKADAPLCEVETDKATMDVPAGVAGTVLKILRPEGDDVPVLQPIAAIGEPGEAWVADDAGGDAGALVATPMAPAAAIATPAPTAAPAGTKSTNAAAADGAGTASPRARALAAAEGVNVAALAGSGPHGRVIERDVRGAIAERPALTAAARSVIASGAAPGGSGFGFAGAGALGNRAGLSDLVRAAAGGMPAGAATTSRTSIPASIPANFPGPVTRTPLKGVRRIIADRMRQSLAGTAQLTLHASAPAARLTDLRARMKAAVEARGLSGVTIGDLVLYATARALREFPALNAHLVDGELRAFERVHLGLAVDTPRGLMVPVIRNADLLGLREMSAEAKRLAAACSGGTVQPDELSGSTFTVSNLGAFGIERFTPILNAPETGILGLCAIVDGRIGLSLTIDHQAVDGADGARFLKSLSAAIADIDLILIP